MDGWTRPTNLTSTLKLKTKFMNLWTAFPRNFALLHFIFAWGGNRKTSFCFRWKSFPFFFAFFQRLLRRFTKKKSMLVKPTSFDAINSSRSCNSKRKSSKCEHHRQRFEIKIEKRLFRVYNFVDLFVLCFIVCLPHSLFFHHWMAVSCLFSLFFFFWTSGKR